MELFKANLLPLELCYIIEKKTHNLLMTKIGKTLVKYKKYNHLLCADKLNDKEWQLRLLTKGFNSERYYYTYYHEYLMSLGEVLDDEDDDDDEEEEEEHEEIIDYNNFNTPINYNPVIYIWEE